MAVPIYDDDQTDSGSASGGISNASAGQLSPLTAKFIQYYIETQQHQLDSQQLAALKAWRSKYLQSLKK